MLYVSQPYYLELELSPLTIQQTSIIIERPSLIRAPINWREVLVATWCLSKPIKTHAIVHLGPAPYRRSTYNCSKTALTTPQRVLSN